VATLTLCCLNIVRMPGFMRMEQLSVNRIAAFRANSSFRRSSSMKGIKTVVTYYWKSTALICGLPFLRRSTNVMRILSFISCHGQEFLHTMCCAMPVVWMRDPQRRISPGPVNREGEIYASMRSASGSRRSSRTVACRQSHSPRPPARHWRGSGRAKRDRDWRTGHAFPVVASAGAQ
jgi:hypothetical protein